MRLGIRLQDLCRFRVHDQDDIVGTLEQVPVVTLGAAQGFDREMMGHCAAQAPGDDMQQVAFLAEKGSVVALRTGFGIENFDHAAAATFDQDVGGMAPGGRLKIVQHVFLTVKAHPHVGNLRELPARRDASEGCAEHLFLVRAGLQGFADRVQAVGFRRALAHVRHQRFARLLGLAALLADLFLTQGALDRHWQAREPMLEHEIHRAQLDHLHRGLFPQRPRHQHYGKFLTGVAHHREHVPAIPSRQAVIAKDQVVIARTQSLLANCSGVSTRCWWIS